MRKLFAVLAGLITLIGGSVLMAWVAGMINSPDWLTFALGIPVGILAYAVGALCMGMKW